MASEIVDDKRVIHDAWSNDGRGATVGYDGVTRIDAYLENGQMAGVPWLHVWKGDVIIARLNAAAITRIEYVDP